ncbi:MAG: protein phosphatase CheZ [Deltaproteobacteria bacterium]|jgi:chemotaxis regulatin CheY-phosphate phosphatase CheZ|nr:protein phosphatase CheZ [Deltaproteobacteria bacterium]
MTKSPPVIGFELGVGEFRIVTPQAIYNIRVIPELVKANTDLGVLSPVARLVSDKPAPPPAQTPPATSSLGVTAEPAFFQEISEELYERIGQLARQLSISVTEIPDNAPSLSQTGADLEDAKGQLAEVVEITEKASMTIMDVADQIQEDMESLTKQMSVLTNLESLLEKPSAEISTAQSSSAYEAFVAGFGDLKAALAGFQAEEGQLSPEPPVAAAPPASVEPAPIEEPSPAAEPTMLVQFDLDAIFQTLYEFCTNESVKAHIKTMRATSQAGGFHNENILKALSDLALTLENDEGFYNVPIPGLLKILYSNATAEEDKSTIKKMNQTASSIFLDGNLPVEGHLEEVAPLQVAEVEVVAEEPEEPASEEASPALSSSQDGPQSTHPKAIIAQLETLLPNLRSSGESFVAIPKTDRDAIVQAVASSDVLIKNTTGHLTRILEALSFQDLSGQRIKKIVNLISEIQVQLLSLLVSVDSKIKAHKDAPSQPRPKEETDKVAQAEVDRMLEKLNAEPSTLKGPGADNRLDQGAVNDLLAELGF